MPVATCVALLDSCELTAERKPRRYSPDHSAAVAAIAHRNRRCRNRRCSRNRSDQSMAAAIARILAVRRIVVPFAPINFAAAAAARRSICRTHRPRVRSSNRSHSSSGSICAGSRPCRCRTTTSQTAAAYRNRSKARRNYRNRRPARSIRHNRNFCSPLQPTHGQIGTWVSQQQLNV